MTSSITRYELTYGALRLGSKRQKIELAKIEKFLGLIDELPFQKTTAQIAARIRRELETKGPMTPLLWTRGLHKYEEFDQPYGGHVAFLDGHVMYYEGTPGEPNPELTELFGPESEFSKTVLILEHEPENWAVEKLAPLPVRYAKSTVVKHSDLLGILAIFFGPATIAALLVGILPKPTTRQRLRSASIAFGVVLIATLLLTSTVC